MKGFFAAATAVVALLAGSASARISHRDLEKRIDHTGRMTWFNAPQGNDACGFPVVSGMPAVHVGKDLWRNGKNCNQWVSITIGDKQSYGVVSGHCDTCSVDQIDTVPGLFSDFDNTDVGILQAKWKFMNKAWSPPDMEECDY